jgi:hypothetical protein
VERLRFETSAPERPASSAPDALDIAGLVAAAAQDAEFEQIVAELVAGVADKLPRELRDECLAVNPQFRAAMACDFLAGARE